MDNYKKNHKNDVSKVKLNRKLDLLDSLSVESERFFSSHMKYYNFIFGIQGLAVNTNEDPVKILNDTDKDFQKELSEKTMDFIEAAHLAENIKGKLYLLGLNEAEKYIQNTDDIVSEVRSNVVFKRKLPSLVNLEKKLTKIEENKSNYFKEIHDYLKKAE